MARYRMTPARRLALRKAQLASARKRKGTGKSRNSGVIPYARANKRSQTVGANAGARITRNHRIVVGGYARIESTRRHTATDKIAGKAARGIFPKSTRRGRAAGYLSKNLAFNNPGVRATTKRGNSVRLGTSRGAGPTVIVRRGRHKTSQKKSVTGISKYNKRMNTIIGKKASKPRPARRKTARRKKKK